MMSEKETVDYADITNRGSASRRGDLAMPQLAIANFSELINLTRCNEVQRCGYRALLLVIRDFLPCSSVQFDPVVYR
jgi:hypothetical protein